MFLGMWKEQLSFDRTGSNIFLGSNQTNLLMGNEKKFRLVLRFFLGNKKSTFFLGNQKGTSLMRNKNVSWGIRKEHFLRDMKSICMGSKSRTFSSGMQQKTFN